MDQPLVTVVIPVYNREACIAHAIESIIGQTYENWKLLIMDDGSTDRTVKIARRYLTDPRIELVCLPENGGAGKTLAAAMDIIDTPFFVILDSDDWLDPTALHVLLTHMKNQPETTNLVYSNTVLWKKERNGIRIKKVQKHRSFYDKYDFIMYRKMVYPRFFRTQAVRDVEGFQLDDPYQGRYMQDRYLLLKLIEKGNFHWVDANLYHQLRHHDNNTRRENRPKYGEVREYVYRKLLKQWGDDYEPIFEQTETGWLHLKELNNKRAPKVTVVMPVDNGPNFITEAIESVCNQSMSEWKLLIFDNASSNDTASTIRPFLHDPRIKYIRKPVNQIVCHVMNDALKLIDTPYFVQLGASDWFETDALSSLTDAMEAAGPEVAVAHGNTNDICSDEEMVYPRFYRTEAVRAAGGWEVDLRFDEDLGERQLLLKLAEHYRFQPVDKRLYKIRTHKK